MGRVLAIRACALALLLPGLAPAVGAAGPEREVREYRGEKLDPFQRDYDNSIKGPQDVDRGSYRLGISGLVATPRSLSYEQVLALPQVERVLSLHCVEGWSEKLLFQGVRLADLLALAGPKPGVTTIIFRAVDGYSSALPYAFVKEKDLMLAARINGLVLDRERGFPFQVVAESKYGYKWVKWVSGIELSDKPHLGHWESLGYDDGAEVPPPRGGK